MKTRDYAPTGRLSAYVQRILIIEHTQVIAPFVLPLYANGSPTLLFQTAKGHIQNSANNLTLFGQTVAPETLTIKENFILIAYFFKPFLLCGLFGVSAQELTDTPIDLRLLTPTTTRELHEQLLYAASVEEMLALLDDYVYSLAAKAKADRDTELLAYATTSIVQNPCKESLVQVQNTLAITERTFQRMFERKIGVSPNQYRRVCQFNAAFEQLNRKHFRKLTDIALMHGYADQSHYIRAFREFTSITPKDYLQFASPE